jgi:hypothetical protein
MHRRIALIGGLALASAAYATGKVENDMTKMEAIIRVEEPLRSKGGVVFVLPHKMPPAEFEARYRDRASSTAPGTADERAVLLEGSVRSTVSFVHFDVPEEDYEYKFLPAEDASPGDGVVAETQITIGGSGYTVAETGLPFDNVPILVHYIQGADLSLGDARAIASEPTGFTISAGDCRASGDFKLCEPTAENLAEVRQFLRAAEEDVAQ